MICKWAIGGEINLFQYFQTGINYFCDSFRVLFCSFSYLGIFFYSSLQWGEVTLLRRDAVESPVSGTVSPRDKDCPRKTDRPPSGLQETSRSQSGSLSGWPQAPFRSPGSPLSIFPRGRTPVPRWGPSGFPLLEKKPKTQEVPWRSRLGPTRGESSPTFNFAKYESSEKKTRSYWCVHRTSCGMRVLPLVNAYAHAPPCHCACAK